jgi:hypothetical protein
MDGHASHDPSHKQFAFLSFVWGQPRARKDCLSAQTRGGHPWLAMRVSPSDVGEKAPLIVMRGKPGDPLTTLRVRDVFICHGSPRSFWRASIAEH